MISRFLIVSMLLLFACPGRGEANSTSLVSCDLSLTGYKLGMSPDEVAKVRPFRYEQAGNERLTKSQAPYALVDNAYIDGAAMSILVSFKKEKVYKIVARVSPDTFDNVLRSIQQSVGAGEDKSRDITYYNGEKAHQAIHLWDFPNAAIHLVEISSNHAFATISLTGK